MPNTASAKKRLRQSLVRRARNRAARSALKTAIRRVRAAAESGDIGQAEADFRVAVKRLDQTAAQGIIHDNAAARTKSRLSALVKSAKQKMAAPVG